jgi:signal transduction histidine kinase
MGYIGSVIDITQRKQAEEALSSVSRKLIEGQEIERTRIARELHDDVSQRLALIAVNLEAAKQKLASSESRARHGIEETCQQVSELASAVHVLSHQLHSSKLSILGVVAACAGFCREFSERYDVKIDFQSSDIPKTLPPELSVCLFRILQEAVQNAYKHSGVRHYQVSLTSVSNVIRLSVHDAGFGFDPQETMYSEGLGLTSMRERLKLVDGELTVESNPQQGTTVTACIPFHVAVMVATAGRT